MQAANKFKHWLLQHHLWLTAGLFGASIATLVIFGARLENTVKITIIGVPFSFVFLAQTQKREETRLFKELFQEFNTRYDDLNGDLNRILRGENSLFLTPEDRHILYDYFNLCGEEYLFYRLGYIPDDVWRSWHQGMMIFLNRPRIRKEWDDDPGSDSYYGLTFPEPPPPPSSDGGAVRVAA